jgi:hypothetical protein
MADWNRTRLAHARIGDQLEPNGTYKGRHIIGRDTPIDGGVSLGGQTREAIVVDSQKYPKIQALYGDAKIRASEGNHVQRDLVLQAVYDTVSKALPTQSPSAVEALIEEWGVGKDGKVALDAFIAAGVGVCRHSALTAGVLLELFKREGHIRGIASVDRNSTSQGAHEWARYTAHNGTVTILDITQKYLGGVFGAAWPYWRDTDMQEFRKNIASH